MTQFVQMHMPSMRKELQTYFIIQCGGAISLRRCAVGLLEELPLTKFLSNMSESYSSLTEVPMSALLMFPSTYLCEDIVDVSIYLSLKGHC